MRPAVPALALAALLSLSACGGGEEEPLSGAQTPTPQAVQTAEPAPTDLDVTPDAVETPDPQVEEGVVIASFTVAGGEVQGFQERLQVPVGDTVRMQVTSDTADEVHVHGYDQYTDLAPGIATTVEVEATIPGVYEVELHDSGVLLTRLQVG